MEPVPPPSLPPSSYFGLFAFCRRKGRNVTKARYPHYFRGWQQSLENAPRRISYYFRACCKMNLPVGERLRDKDFRSTDNLKAPWQSNFTQTKVEILPRVD